MATSRIHSWQAIRELIRERIKDRTWSPGELIPGEVVLAGHFGCSRATVNRALRELASTGVIDRKRKAGTRVTKQQTRRVTAEIPVIRAQVESQNLDYRFVLLNKKQRLPTKRIKNAMQLDSNDTALHIRSVHFANELPYIFEDRWVNTQTISELLAVDLKKISVNEWLVENVPFTRGEFIVQAVEADKTVAKALGLAVGQSLLTSERSTWLEDESVTIVKLNYAPGYRMRFEI